MVDVEQLRSHTLAELGAWQVPAVELVAVKDGETLLAEAFGLRNVEQNLPATPATLFHHGSTGKAFTGVLAGTLVDAGLLEWDRPIREYLPDFRLHNQTIAERVTLADLLSHRSGLPRHELAWLANPSLSRAELVRRLRYLESPFDLRSTFQYCNLAYLTVGHLIAVITGTSWEEEMRRRVLDPLAMDRTVTSVDEAQAAEHAQPYSPFAVRRSPFGVRRSSQTAPRTANSEQRTAIPWRRSDQIAPAGQMISCAVDMAQWLRLQLSDGEVDGTRVISSAALARTKTIHTPLDTPGPAPDIRFYGYGFGWIMGTYRGRRLVWHNGGIDGFHTDIAFLPDDGIAAAASSNVLVTNLPFALVFHTLDTLLGVEPKPWSENLRAADAAQPTPPKPRTVRGTHPSHPLEEYAGVYEHPGYGTFEVTLRGRALHLRLGELDLSARHRHYDTWTVRYAPLDLDWPLTFLTNPDGEIAAAEMPLEPAVKPIRFERKQAAEG